MNNMQKHTLAKVLKVIFYLLGFPLLIFLVAKDSMPYFKQDMFDGTAKDGILVVAILWLGITILQIGLYLVMKKQQALRTIIVIIIALVVMMAPVVALDAKNNQTITEIQDNAEKGVVVNDYSLQKQHFVTVSKDYASYTDATLKQVEELIRVYGLKYYYPHMYRTHSQLNTTTYFITEDGTKYTIEDDGTKIFDSIQDQNPIAYNQNGLLADNYIFGVENVIDLLIDYNEYSAKSVYRAVNSSRYTGDGKAAAVSNKWYIKTTDANGDKVYNRYVSGNVPDNTFYEKVTLAEAYTQLVSEMEDFSYDFASAKSRDGGISWAEYIDGTYQIYDQRYDSYTTYSALKAEADKYVLTSQRLNDLLGVLFEYIGAAPGVNDLISQLNLNNILNLVGALLTEDTSNVNGGSIGSVITQLLYGYYDGISTGDEGRTTGLALPAQYLFNNLNFTGSTKKTSIGYLNTVSGGKLNPDTISGDTSKYVFTVTYSKNDKEEIVGTVSYKNYDKATMTIGVPEISDLMKLDDSAQTAALSKIYTNGEVFEKTDLATAYTDYVNSLKGNTNYYLEDSGVVQYDYTSIAALVDLIKSLQPALGLVGGLLSGDTILGLLGGVLPGLDLASILNAVLKEGAMDTIVSDLLSSIDLTGITVEGVKDLLMGILGELSYYQHPLLKKCWQSDFLTTADLNLDVVGGKGEVVSLGDYAWNKYACEDFGITNGCVLIAKGGLLTGTTLGNGASADDAFTLVELYQLRTDLSYMPTMYPLLSARRYLIMWTGMIAMSIFFSTYFYNKEKRYLYLATLEGGAF